MYLGKAEIIVGSLPGGGGTPLHLRYRYVPPQSVWLLRRLIGLKTCMDFTYFGLSSGMVFREIRECMNVFVVSISNE